MEENVPRISWKTYALKLATVASERSEDPFMKVGACTLRFDNSVAGLGYNGAPPGININWTNRDQRRNKVIHAEVNALRYVRPDECYFLACTHLPCNDCLKLISSYGIKEIYFNEVYQRDMSSLDLAPEFDIKLLCTENVTKSLDLVYKDKISIYVP
jgi:dCMP deaminase